MENIINEFRAQNGKEAVSQFDRLVNDYCLSHCMAMARNGYIYHAEPSHLEGWSEAVAMGSYNGDFFSSVRRIMHEAFGKSELHKSVILDHSTLAFGVFTSNYKMFVTIRGR